jgi:hypothetical protein
MVVFRMTVGKLWDVRRNAQVKQAHAEETKLSKRKRETVGERIHAPGSSLHSAASPTSIS